MDISFDKDYFKDYKYNSVLVKYFEDDNVKDNLKNIAAKIVRDFSPKTVLDCSCVGGYLVRYLSELGVEAYGISYSDYIINKIEPPYKSNCYSCSILDGLPQELPPDYDLVVCFQDVKYVNFLYFEEVICKISKLSRNVLFGYFSVQDHPHVEYAVDRISTFFAKNNMFRSLRNLFDTPYFKVAIYEKVDDKDIHKVVEEYEGYIKNKAFIEKRLISQNKYLNDKVLKYSQNSVIFKNFNYKYYKLKKEMADLKLQNRALRITENMYGEIKNAFFWKITKPARVVVDFFKWLLKNFRSILFKVLRSMQPKKIKSFIVFVLRFGLIAGVKQLFKVNKNITHLVLFREYFKKVSPTKKELEYQRRFNFNKRLIFSVVVPLYNTPIKFLKAMIESVINQTYPYWQLCLADGSDDTCLYVKKCCEEYMAADSRIIYKKLDKNMGISENTNAALKLATGDYIALLDHDDMLAPTALFENARVIEEKGADFIYSDEMTFTNDNLYDITFMNFKPDFAPDTLLTNNYICHLSVFSKKLQEKVGFFSSEYDGSQDYDFVLRLSEHAKLIYHIPKLLYYWRASANSVASDVSAKPYCIESGKKAIAAHLSRIGRKAKVLDTKYPSTYKIEYSIKGEPLVSILIPNKDHLVDLSVCVKSILEKSTYKNFEIVIIENGSDFETLDYYKVLEKKDNRIKVVYYKGGFNYSAINNFGIKFVKGDYFIFLNNDTEIISPNWIEEMLMFAQRSDVGAVGAKLYYEDDTIQHAGVVIGILGLAGHVYRHLPKHVVGYCFRPMLVQNLSAVTAACFMTSRSAFNKVGGFDEDIKVAFNDVDFCLRLRQAGFLVVFTPYAELYHYESKSRGSDNDTPSKFARFSYEVELMCKRWEKILKDGDPYYNKNLTLENEGYGLRF